MTKVILTRSVLQHRQAMAELVNEVCEENRVAAAGRENMKNFYPHRTSIPELWTPGLLPSPKIEMLWPTISLKDGHLDGIIQVNTSEEYGVLNVYIVLEDEQGNRIESDYAMDNDYMENHWGYIPAAPVQPGTTIVVRAMAIDALGGMSIQTERVTV